MFDYSRKLRHSIRNFAPDLLHSNGLKMNVLEHGPKAPVCPSSGTFHDYVSSRPFMRKALRLYARRAAAMLANFQLCPRRSLRMFEQWGRNSHSL